MLLGLPDLNKDSLASVIVLATALLRDNGRPSGVFRSVVCKPASVDVFTHFSWSLQAFSVKYMRAFTDNTGLVPGSFSRCGARNLLRRNHLLACLESFPPSTPYLCTLEWHKFQADPELVPSWSQRFNGFGLVWLLQGWYRNPAQADRMETMLQSIDSVRVPFNVLLGDIKVELSVASTPLLISLGP